MEEIGTEALTLERKKHVKRLTTFLTKPLPELEMLVPLQPWMIYWVTHALSLLEQQPFLKSVNKDVINFLRECSNKDGGYGGGLGQIAHLGTSFSAVSSLVSMSNEEALESIDRIALVKFLHRMKRADGSFSMHDDGEIDSRASYCALSIMRCLNIHDSVLLENVAEWLLSCQTYEGGFGSVPGSEAHGGYTFCCVAALCLVNQLERADLPALLRWLVNKQLSDDGGFCGRSNKLVDSCYSYWQGAVFPLIHPYLKSRMSNQKLDQESSSDTDSEIRGTRKRLNRRCKKSDDADRGELEDLLDNWLFDCAALQDYILSQCQAGEGLLRDKPTAEPDFYHTCYALSGLSLSQHQNDGSIFNLGSHAINIIAPTHPLFNVVPDSLAFCLEYFRNKRIDIERKEDPSET